MEKELRLRISEELKSKLKDNADKLNISLSAYVRMILTKDTND